jgi:hypothetical protein
VGNSKYSNNTNHSARSIALLVLFAIFIGNLLCESGNLLAIKVQFQAHFFNKYLLGLAIVYIVGYGIARYCRRHRTYNSTMGEVE